MIYLDYNATTPLCQPALRSDASHFWSGITGIHRAFMRPDARLAPE